MNQRNLNIEMMIDTFDFQEDGDRFSIKFIDPNSGIFKIVNFVKNSSMEINPEGIINPIY
jgi:hypothetical protein